MNLNVHEKILRDALGHGNIMSSQALRWIIRANKFSDLHQFAAERHFDNAPNREMLCDRWKRGLKTYMDSAIDLSNPNPTLKDRKRALYAFGAATHALADFYAHTNWVELSVAQGDYETLAPLLGNVCSVNDFPVGLESGYFHLRHGVRGCPKAGPPSGYTFCHEQIAKDHPDRGHGADYISTAGRTYHALAVSLASRATFQLWKLFQQRIVARYTTTTTAGEAVFHELAWGKERSAIPQ